MGAIYKNGSFYGGGVSSDEVNALIAATGIEDRLITTESKIDTIETNLTTDEAKIKTIENKLSSNFIQEAGGNMDIETGVLTKTASITLPSGIWYVSVNVRWDTGSADGIRSLILTTATNQTTEGSASHQADFMRVNGTMPGINRNHVTHVQNGLIRVTASESTFHLYVYQNSGKTLTSAYNLIGAYKIRGL